jgi:hypothetical protein
MSCTIFLEQQPQKLSIDSFQLHVGKQESFPQIEFSIIM